MNSDTNKKIEGNTPAPLVDVQNLWRKAERRVNTSLQKNTRCFQPSFMLAYVTFSYLALRNEKFTLLLVGEYRKSV